MRAHSTTQSVTVRLPRPLYARATDLAKERRVSLNAFVQQGVEEAVRLAEERERYDAYSMLGEDAAECDVEYAIHAQAEVMLRDAS